MFDTLTDRLQSVLRNIKGEDRLTRENVDKALVEIRKALLEADVNLTTIKIFLDNVRNTAVGEKIAEGLTPSQKFTEIVHQELLKILGGEISQLNLSAKPSLIMLLGLQGSGKTTTCAKLALTLKNSEKKVLLVPLDFQRPAAVEQLRILSETIQVDFFTPETGISVLEAAKIAVEKAQTENYDVMIFDTAGRLQIDSDLMAELLLLEKKFKPQEKLLVIDSLIGQEAAVVAQTFDKQIGITGAIITKLDGDSRGGAALSLVERTGKKIKFVGLGEKIEPLEEFDPQRMAGRILGFGDVIALVKKVENEVSKKEAEEFEKNMKKGVFTFESFIQMQRMLKKLGGFGQVFDLMGMGALFGLGKKERDVIMGEGMDKLKTFEYIIQSMTKQERNQPEILESVSASTRIKRIARGSGRKESEVRGLVKEFSKMRQVMKLMGPLMGNAGQNPSNFNLMDMLGSFGNMSNSGGSNMPFGQKKEKKKRDFSDPFFRF